MLLRKYPIEWIKINEIHCNETEHESHSERLLKYTEWKKIKLQSSTNEMSLLIKKRRETKSEYINTHAHMSENGWENGWQTVNTDCRWGGRVDQEE